MNTPAFHSDQILREANRSLAFQKAGGRRVPSIGRGAAQAKARHFGRKLRNMLLAVAAVWFGLVGIGWALNGVGIFGLFLGILCSAVALWAFARYPRLKVPARADLDPASTNVRGLVEQTELWLEGQRAALPPPAIQLVDRIGLQLDVLEPQLLGVDQAHPQAGEVRKLVGEHLPDLIENFRKIPEHLRYEKQGEKSPADQFLASLETISAEIDSVTRQLASGAIDNLAIKTRYLDYKYGDALDEASPAAAKDN